MHTNKKFGTLRVELELEVEHNKSFIMYKKQLFKSKYIKKEVIYSKYM